MTTFPTDMLRDTLISWLRIDSVTPGERAFLEHLQGFFESRGWQVRRQPITEERWNIVVTRPGRPNPSLLYSTHVDTVPPCFAPRVEGERVFGRGACDTKGGLLAMVAAAHRLLDAGHDDVGFLLVVGEEVDHRGAKASRALADITPKQIVLCEPTINRVVAAQKGMVKCDLEADGVAAHSAYPERGDSALHRMIASTHGLLSEDWPVDELLGPTTLNVGELHSGIAANVFAPSATASLVIRTVRPTADYTDVLERHTAPHRVRITNVVQNDPVFFTPPDGVETCTVAFNTDATYLAELGPVWLVGPGDIEVAHTDHEHIDLRELVAGVHLYERLGRLVLSG
ncbi:MAG: M20/M25/M40 family metallo-hydrolase [Myxococcota bacterium]